MIDKYTHYDYQGIYFEALRISIHKYSVERQARHYKCCECGGQGEGQLDS